MKRSGQAPPVFLGHPGLPIRPCLADPAGKQGDLILRQPAVVAGDLAEMRPFQLLVSLSVP